jgi:hypothetical protein
VVVAGAMVLVAVCVAWVTGAVVFWTVLVTEAAVVVAGATVLVAVCVAWAAGAVVLVTGAAEVAGAVVFWTVLVTGAVVVAGAVVFWTVLVTGAVVVAGAVAVCAAWVTGAVAVCAAWVTGATAEVTPAAAAVADTKAQSRAVPISTARRRAQPADERDLRGLISWLVLRLLQVRPSIPLPVPWLSLLHVPATGI